MRKNILMVTALLLVGLSACSGQLNGNAVMEEADPANKTTVAGYGFTTSSGLRLGVGMAMEEVADKLGSPRSVQVSESCAFGGKDRAYLYEGMQICTNDESGWERIYEITLTDGSQRTQEGIFVGVPTSQVTAVYGPSQSTGGSLISYQKEGMRLLFVIRDGKVATIRYTAL